MYMYTTDASRSLSFVWHTNGSSEGRYGECAEGWTQAGTQSINCMTESKNTPQPRGLRTFIKQVNVRQSARRTARCRRSTGDRCCFDNRSPRSCQAAARGSSGMTHRLHPPPPMTPLHPQMFHRCCIQRLVVVVPAQCRPLSFH